MTPNVSKLVERRLNDFKRRCGKNGDAALQLAYHAAMPVALNPELLHFLRINFFLDPPEQLPYTVEFEFLSSGLCREIDAELYEIEPEIRNELLQKLMSREDAQQRIRDIATLLWQYVEQHSPWADRVELERAQQLTALNFLDSAKAKQWLDEAEANGSLGTGEREWFIAMRQEIEELPEISTLSAEKQSEQSDLPSEKGVDYTRLRDLLAAGKWKEADEETLAVMLKATGREEQRWLDIESIENFPCTDLRTIDQLWVKSSNGRFGFSVQKRIWESVGGNRKANNETFEKFGDRVGWRRRRIKAMLQKEWLHYEELNFTTQGREGHLPYISTLRMDIDHFYLERVGLLEIEGGCKVGKWYVLSSLASRLVKCNL
ncbi:GUN4 domain-containing protein [Kalymmatonema gypsitolerans NIES-4073]|nr:GUN4 domain-containing protein [Scytonema sp. NIES-4073]